MESPARWVDRHRLYLMAIAMGLASIGILLDSSGRSSFLTNLLLAGTGVLIAAVVLARAQRSFRLYLGLLVGVPILATAAIDLFIHPGRHPEAVFVHSALGVAVFIVGFPIGLYSSHGLESQEE